ncbi:hypothetical protein C2G38_2056276 [Gigaspora rosea]|uniref:Uncharacterized protein n=1 Tax=Gigaspora rosea TaxID=44941 RepID=A0A397W6B2_9GLOM|nr:hypothetical protein C2G38_2056276 [Gigaspora rosea]
MTTQSNRCFRVASNDDKLFYARTLWQIHPLLDLSAPDEKTVCKLANNCLLDYNVGIPDVSKFCGATQTSLSGQEEYESYKLSCRVSVSEKYARFVWRWSISIFNFFKFEKTVQFNIGNATLALVSQFENVKMWQEWMDFFLIMSENNLWYNNIFHSRLSDLATIRGKMQEKIEIMVAEKVNHETEKSTLELSNYEFTEEIEPNSNVSNEETEASHESLLTKTFRGTVIVIFNRMGKKPTSIDQFLDPRKNPNM